MKQATSKAFRLQPSKYDTYAQQWMALIGVTAVCLLIVEPARPIEWLTFLGFLFAALLFLYVAIFIHELGHICMAVLLGMKVLGISVGSGRIGFTVKLRDSFLRLGLFPTWGLAFSLHKTEKFYRTRAFLFAAGGPIATALLFWLTVAIRGTFASPMLTDSLIDDFFTLAMGYQILLLIGSLWPHTFVIEGARRPNDALHMLHAFRYSREKISESVAAYHLNRALSHSSTGNDQAISQQFLDDAIAKYPDSSTLHRYRAMLLCRLGKFAEARQIWLSQLESQYLPAEKAATLDALACLPLYYDCPEYLAEAEEWVKQAIALAPDMITLKGTQGSVFVERGRHREGKELLEEVLAKSSNPNDQAISACYLAYLAADEGDAANATQLLELAKKAQPECVVLNRTEARIKAKLR